MKQPLSMILSTQVFLMISVQANRCKDRHPPIDSSEQQLDKHSGILIGIVREGTSKSLILQIISAE